MLFLPSQIFFTLRLTFSNHINPLLMADKCPVDHDSREEWVKKMLGSSVPTEDPSSSSAPVSACPVPQESRSTWLLKLKFTSSAPEAIEETLGGHSSAMKSSDIPSITSETASSLPQDRQISSIPRTDSPENWVYPSQKQFFDAMTRKNWNPQEEDMKTVVPIHNLVNERVWTHVLMWERAHVDESLKKCGGIKLTSFKGDLKKLTPRAWINTFIFGREKPFDRHDWLVDRCGVSVPYVIDFYGSDSQEGGNVHIDVRPKLQSWEGFKLRIGRIFGLC